MGIAAFLKQVRLKFSSICHVFNINFESAFQAILPNFFQDSRSSRKRNVGMLSEESSSGDITVKIAMFDNYFIFLH